MEGEKSGNVTYWQQQLKRAMVAMVKRKALTFLSSHVAWKFDF